MVDRSAGSDRLSESLTEREQEILACLAEGLTNREIAERLHLAHRTIKWYNAQIYSKLEVSNREEAIAQSAAKGLLAHVPDVSELITRHNLLLQPPPSLVASANWSKSTVCWLIPIYAC